MACGDARMTTSSADHAADDDAQLRLQEIAVNPVIHRYSLSSLIQIFQTGRPSSSRYDVECLHFMTGLTGSH